MVLYWRRLKKRVGNSDDSSLKVRKGILSLAALKCILHSRSFGDLGLEIYIILFARLGLIKLCLLFQGLGFASKRQLLSQGVV